MRAGSSLHLLGANSWGQVGDRAEAMYTQGNPEGSSPSPLRSSTPSMWHDIQGGLDRTVGAPVPGLAPRLYSLHPKQKEHKSYSFYRCWHTPSA